MSAREDDGATAALRAAVVWRLRLTEAGLETRPDFELWLAAAPTHAQAWVQVQSAWSVMEGAEAPELSELRRVARARRPRRGSAWRLLAAAAALALAVPACFSAMGLMRSDEVLSTPRTERRFARLEDGTGVTLDAGTRIRVRMQAGRRDIDLVEGQARFDVAHDVERPFRVRAGHQSVTALGTVFTVEHRARAVSVTLLEGRVLVADQAQGGAGEGTATILAPGQRLETGAAGATSRTRVRAVSLAQATAWEAGRLVFEDEPLGLVAERVSRYLPHPIVVDDADTAQLRVSGAFQTGDGRAFVEAVSAGLGLRVERSPDGTIRLLGLAQKIRPASVGNPRPRRLPS